MIAAPADAWVFFRPDRAGAYTTDVGTDAGLRVAAVRWSRSLEGRGWLIQVLVAHEAGGAIPGDLAMIATPRGAKGKPRGPITSKASRCLLRDSTALLWAIFPDSSLEGAQSVTVALDAPGRGPRMEMSVDDPSDLPPGASIAPSGRALIWSPAPWRIQAPPPVAAPGPGSGGG